MRVGIDMSQTGFALNAYQPGQGYPATVSLSLTIIDDTNPQAPHGIVSVAFGIPVGDVETASQAVQIALTRLVQTGEALKAEAQRQLSARTPEDPAHQGPGLGGPIVQPL